MMKSMRVLGVLGLVVTLTELSGAQSSVEWARFRGPNGSGIADDNKPPITFGPSEKRLWKTAVPRGHSSPTIEARASLCDDVDIGQPEIEMV